LADAGGKAKPSDGVLDGGAERRGERIVLGEPVERLGGAGGGLGRDRRARTGRNKSDGGEDDRGDEKPSDSPRGERTRKAKAGGIKARGGLTGLVDEMGIEEARIRLGEARLRRGEARRGMFEDFHGGGEPFLETGGAVGGRGGPAKRRGGGKRGRPR